MTMKKMRKVWVKTKPSLRLSAHCERCGRLIVRPNSLYALQVEEERFLQGVWVWWVICWEAILCEQCFRRFRDYYEASLIPCLAEVREI